MTPGTERTKQDRPPSWLAPFLEELSDRIGDDCTYITANYRGETQEIRYGVAWVLKSALIHAANVAKEMGE